MPGGFWSEASRYASSPWRMLAPSQVEACHAATAPTVGVIDADLTHPRVIIPRMFAVMRQHAADVVIGSRYFGGGGTRDWALSPLAMSKSACLLARGLTPVR